MAEDVSVKKLYEYGGKLRPRYVCVYIKPKQETASYKQSQHLTDRILPRTKPEEGMVIDLATQKIVGAWLADAQTWLLENEQKAQEHDSDNTEEAEE